MRDLSARFDQSIAGVRIASPLVLAPMRGVTTVAYRRLCAEYGAGLTFTECIGTPFLLAAIRQKRPLRFLKRAKVDGPVAVQLGAAEPAEVAEAARHVLEHGYDIVDLNFGCPPRPGLLEGSAVLREPARVGRIVEAVVRAAGNVPVTVKIRAGFDRANQNAVEVAKIAEGAGAKAITVHGRVGSEAYRARAEWGVVADVKRAVSIPVVGNGDVLTPEDAVALLDQTGCDFVMVGRGSYANPWLFKRTNQLLRTAHLPREPSAAERWRAYLRYVELASERDDWPRGFADAGYRLGTVTRRWRRGNQGTSPLEQTAWGRLLLDARRWSAKRRLAAAQGR